MSFVWFLLAAVLLILWFRATKSRDAAEAKRNQLQKEAAELWEDRKGARADVERLSAELENVRAERDASRARLARIAGLGEIEDGLAYASALRAQVDAERAKSVEDLEAARARRSEIQERAEAEGRRIIAAAEQRAEEIAGAAYQVAQRESELKKSVRALENTINGYGDAYLVPTSSLMDELEERYGFADAGASLKSARQHVNALIKSGAAATCDYVEKNRKETAIAFVLDAFNGKVDSAMAAVRSDNFGKLEQQIRDAYQLVNFHGEAFRSARIEPQYLEAQLAVLRWAVAVQELRRLEKEEQQALREAMREEEQARKEYERALKQASRDEEVARKAVEQAQEALLRSSEAERQKFEEQLAALTEKLKAAEERGQRALSMAQQTRAGTVYVISNIGSFGEDVFKIGMTRRMDPEDRVRELGDASVPFSFDVHALIKTDDAPTLEKTLHKAFVRAQVNKVNYRKEFFRLALNQIRAEVERLGIQASWTMAAACVEWKETRAIEAQIAVDGESARKWEERQVRLEETATV